VAVWDLAGLFVIVLVIFLGGPEFSGSNYLGLYIIIPFLKLVNQLGRGP